MHSSDEENWSFTPTQFERDMHDIQRVMMQEILNVFRIPESLLRSSSENHTSIRAVFPVAKNYNSGTRVPRSMRKRGRGWPKRLRSQRRFDKSA